MGIAAETAIDVRPFQVKIPEEELAELRRRLRSTATTECGTPSPIGTGRPSTSQMRRAGSGTTTSARASTTKASG